MPPLELQDRDRRVLRHVARYRITTPEVLQRLFCNTKDATKKLTSRLAVTYRRDVDEAEQRKLAVGYVLQARELLGKRRLYQLTARGAKEAGVPVERADPIGPQALVEAYAILVHCCLGDAERELLTAPDLARLPRLADVPPANYYLDQVEERTVLTRIVVDHRSEVPSIVRKCREIIKDARETPTLAQMMDGGRYALVVLTLHDEKAAGILEFERRDPLAVSLRTDTIPLLSDIIERVRDA